MNILQRIFTDHYEEMIYTLHPRTSVIENVDKMINCGNPAFGGAMYGCPRCGKLKFVPFRCHSRFCPTCGNLYAMQRTTSMSFKLVNVSHRHCVFTIDRNLRQFFLDDRTLLDCLFHAVNSVVSQVFYKQNKSMNFTPGFIMVLHTFGRDLKWNPHIHCLISEGGYSDNGFWRNINYFNYTYLRNAFRTALLNEMEAKIGPSFKKVKSLCYQEHKEGFYVYAKPNKCDPKTVVKYIGRYLGRPVIATSRIDKKLHRAISREKHHIYRTFNQWRTAILSAFGYDPLKCECGTTMLFLELYFNHKRVSLEEMYEKVMSRSRGRRSSA